jgi:hypothetical protein
MPADDAFYCHRLLEICTRLHNVRTRLEGINQIKTVHEQCCTRDENSRRGSQSRENRAVSKCLAGLVTVSTILDRSRRSR